MTEGKKKCVIILSTKSAGSSALQDLLCKSPHVRTVKETRHFENETLYWVKAASVLQMPQINMVDSEVPLSQKKAREDLIQLLSKNLDDYIPPRNDREMIFDGWRKLCYTYSPVFLEKSPHHLLQWSSLLLIAECIEKFPEIDFFIVGLIRNPMDTLYSMWSRWRSFPEIKQKEWATAYDNLLRFKKVVGAKLILVRYEDLVADDTCIQDLYQFIGSPDFVGSNYFHKKSLGKWRSDKTYGFTLSADAMGVAKRYGYEEETLVNDKEVHLWSVCRVVSRYAYKAFSLVKKMMREIFSL